MEASENKRIAKKKWKEERADESIVSARNETAGKREGKLTRFIIQEIGIETRRNHVVMVHPRVAVALVVAHAYIQWLFFHLTEPHFATNQ